MITVKPRVSFVLSVSTGITPHSSTTESVIGDITIPYCADLFRYEFLGGADTWRGRVIRAFMWLMDFWPIPTGKP